MRKQENREKDDDFLIQYEEKLIEFLNSDEEVLGLEPMNSYYRRLIHGLAKQFKFESRSEGEAKDRHVVLAKTANITMPPRIERKEPVVWNFADREFLVDPLRKEVEVFLGKDGSVGVYDESQNTDVIAKKKVRSGAFKIKMNKIVELHDDEW
ncbi:MAG: hypothetical protein GY866_33815 [Proteobacteria bacterium]|nr:hypothetical protein [Pseudomonadota bacterium]